jgi:hypothetical protein
MEVENEDVFEHMNRRAHVPSEAPLEPLPLHSGDDRRRPLVVE